MFARSIDEMVRISLEIITCKHKVDPEYSSVKQKWRKFALERNKIINEEIEKLK